MDRDEIINRIGIIRTRAKITARALSLAINKNPAYINQMESTHGFEPSLSTLLEILEVCGVTPEEFFYSDIAAYQKDKEIIAYLGKLSEKQKNAILNLYEV